MRLPATLITQPAVLVNGLAIDGLLAVEIVSSRSFSADTFIVRAAISTQGLTNTTFWTTLQSAYIEIFTADRATLLISGKLDHLSLDVINGTALLEGRDLSALLMDTTPRADYVNQSASEIVSAIAIQNGLVPQVAATKGASGRYFADNFTRFSLNRFARLRSEWDVVVALARENQFDIYVRGQALYFQPAEPIVPPIILTTADITALRLDRMTWIEQAPNIQVSSWNSQYKNAYLNEDTLPSGSAPYSFGAPNLTSQQVSDAAIRYSAEIAAMRETLVLELPWVIPITPQHSILLAGIDPFIDGLHRIQRIETRYNSRHGSVQTIMLTH